MMSRSVVVFLVLAGCAAQNQQLVARVDALEKAQKVEQPPPPDPDARLVARLEELERRLAAMEGRGDDVTSKLDKIAAKIDDINAATAGRPAMQRPVRPEPKPDVVYSMPIDNNPFDGPADAKVTLVVGTEYACPYCEKVRATFGDLRKKYGKDLRIVAKQFIVHPQVARASALAACAAHKQKRFAEMDNLLWEKGFKNRNFDKDDASGSKCWESSSGCPVIEGFATEIKLDLKRFKNDLAACGAIVDKDIADFQALSIGGIPASFINGRFLSGAMPIENFSLVIDEELAKANERIKNGAPKATYYKKFVVEAGQKSL